MKIKTDNGNYGLVNGIFVFPETNRQYMARLRKVDYREFIKYKKYNRIDDILNSKKRELLSQWFEINHCIAME